MKRIAIAARLFREPTQPSHANRALHALSSGLWIDKKTPQNFSEGAVELQIRVTGVHWANLKACPFEACDVVSFLPTKCRQLGLVFPQDHKEPRLKVRGFFRLSPTPDVIARALRLQRHWYGSGPLFYGACQPVPA